MRAPRRRVPARGARLKRLVLLSRFALVAAALLQPGRIGAAGARAHRERRAESHRDAVRRRRRGPGGRPSARTATTRRRRARCRRSATPSASTTSASSRSRRPSPSSGRPARRLASPSACEGPRHPRRQHPDREARRHRDRRRDARRAGAAPATVARRGGARNTGGASRALRDAVSGPAEDPRLRADRRRAALHGRRPAPHHRDPGALRRHQRLRGCDGAGAAGGPRVGAGARARGHPLARRCRSRAPFWARFDRLAAVARGNVYRAPADLLARPSPRIADGAADVCARLDEARAKAASARLP